MANAITHAGAHRDGLGFFARLQQSWADYRLYRDTLVELQSLTDRDLDDLGISRHSLNDVARDAVYGA